MRYKLSDKEISTLVKNIVILADTKERESSHILTWLKKHRHKVKHQSLKEGDYSGYIEYNEETKKILESMGVYRNLYMTDEILVERKASLDELAGNLRTGKLAKNSEGLIMVYVSQEDLKDKKLVYLDEGGERERFKFELTRIRNCRAKLFLFCEDEHGDKNMRFGIYRSEYDPVSFLGSIKSFEAEFDFSYKFFSKEVMGSEIFNTIKYQIRDVLKKGNINSLKDNGFEEGE